MAVTVPVAGAEAGPIAYVDAGAPGGGDGTSWGTAFNDLQLALDAADVPGSTYTQIWVAAGLYTPSVPTEPGNLRTSTFRLLVGVGLYGGFAGGEDHIDQRNPGANPTVLTGDRDGDDGDGGLGDNAYHVVTASGVNASAVLDGFVITGGVANGPLPHKSGAGIVIESGGPVIANCVFTGHTAQRNGAGGHVVGGTPVFDRCRFAENMAYVDGGGVYLAAGSDAQLDECILEDNTAAQFGGGVYCIDSEPVLSYCVLRRNTALISGGGMFCVDQGHAVLEHCVLAANTNLALAAQFSQPTVRSCTIVGNNYGIGASSSVIVINSILYYNFNFSDSGLMNESAQFYGDDEDVSYCCIQGAEISFDGTFITRDKPMFVDRDGLDDIPGTDDDDLRLRSGSACIDMGDNTAVPEGIAVDFNGGPRFLDDPCAMDYGSGEAPIVDLGAFEFVPPPVPPPQPVLFVDGDATGAGDGSSWEDALTDLRSAICAAIQSEGIVDEIWVAAGTYRPDGPDGSRIATFLLWDGVAIYGGFSGNETQLDQRDPIANPTVLSGDLNGDNIGNAQNIEENSYHVVSAFNTDDTAVLDGVTIIRGNADGFLGPIDLNTGGGIYIVEAGPSIIDCTVQQSRCTDRGGGVTVDLGDPAFADCEFNSNYGQKGGGGAYIVGGTTSFESCLFLSNSTDNNRSGGGLYNDGGDPVLNDCIFDSNFASSAKGMYTIEGAPRLEDCIFRNHTSHGGSGGGMTAASGQPTLIRCQFENNVGGGSASNYAGGLSITDGMLIGCIFRDNGAANAGGLSISGDTVLINCSIVSNGADEGGGVKIYGGNPVFVNCLFAGNNAVDEGGGLRSSGETTLINCTFLENTAPVGNGVYVGSGHTRFVNCILAENGGTGESAQLEISDYGIALVDYSCVQGWTGALGGAGNIGDDPLFADADGRLQPGSPCIDAGHNWAVPSDAADLDGDGNVAELTPVDLDAIPRFSTGPGPPGPGCGIPVIVDMGAHEYQVDPVDEVLRADIDGDGAVGVSDFLALLSAWGPCPDSCCLEDVDLDGVVGLIDFLVLLAHWG
ncbi:MAG: right-handed parallel beta-helix repeat-containing protein [Planctomycetota bacterium]